MPLVVVLVAVGGYLAMSLTGTSLSELLNPPLEVTVRVDQCQFNGGTVRAGGFVTNDGDRTVTVRVNLLVSGRYVGTDIVRDIGPGQRKSWETFDTTTPGSCSAEVEGT